jgi:hypothetical protein
MRHDLPLRAAVRAIFDSCYPSDEWSPVRFDEAERHGTIHYRQAVEAAFRARTMFGATADQQLELI